LTKLRPKVIGTYHSGTYPEEAAMIIEMDAFDAVLRNTM
jgi:hypothetical protein